MSSRAAVAGDAKAEAAAAVWGLKGGASGVARGAAAKAAAAAGDADGADGDNPEWTVVKKCDVFGGQDFMVQGRVGGDATSVARARLVCLNKGCGGFVVYGGKAYFRKHRPAELLAAAKGQAGLFKEATLHVYAPPSAGAAATVGATSGATAGAAAGAVSPDPKRTVVKKSHAHALNPLAAHSQSPTTRDATSVDRPASPTPWGSSFSRPRGVAPKGKPKALPAGGFGRGNSFGTPRRQRSESQERGGGYRA